MSIELRSFKAFRGGFTAGPVNGMAAPSRPLVFYGPNGTGKTTLLLAIAGFLSSEGAVIINGEDVSGLPYGKRGVAYVPARPAMPGWMRVNEISSLAGANGAVEALKALGLGHVWNERAGKLSFGQAKAAQAALALFGRSAAVLLDEPFTGLSDALASSLWEAILASPKPVIITLNVIPGWIQLSNVVSLNPR